MIRRNWDRIRGALRKARLQVLAPKEGYDRWAASYGEAMNPVQVLEAEAMLRFLPNVQGKRVLDLGCGKGRLARLVVERGASDVTGVDVSEAMLVAAEATVPEAQFVQADVRELPFDGSSFDVVVSGLMIGHVRSLNAALAEIARVLQPGGVLLLSDFHPYAALRGWQRTFTDVASGKAYAIEHHPHLLEDYVRSFNALGIVLDTIEEPRHEGFPIVLVLRARKVSDS